MKLPINGGGVNNERVGWEYHDITLSRVPVYGFGIAVSGGRDNPHFMNGDPSIAISDVLKAGPAEGKLLVNDRVISANGISLENVDYSQAIHVLRECGNTVNLLIKRRALISTSSLNANNNNNNNTTMNNLNNNNNHITSSDSNNNLIKVTLTKNSKKDDLGIVLGCKFFVKEIVDRKTNGESIDKEGQLQEGDIIQKINNTNIDNLSLKEVKKLLDNCKDKLTLMIKRDVINQNFLNENGNYINGHSRSNSGISNILRHNQQQTSQKWPTITNGFSESLNSVESNHVENGANHHLHYGAPSFHASNIATMANSRSTNGWNNQNLYVQPPTRMNDSGLTNGGNNTVATVNGQNDLNETISSINNMDSSEMSKLSQRPLPQKPSKMQQGESSPASKIVPKTSDDNLTNETIVDQEKLSVSPTSKTEQVRYIAFQKEGSVGIRLTGGNEVGIFVTAVQPASPAYQQGLKVADKILKANNVDMKNYTREEAVLYLLRIKDRIELYVQNCKEEYENIVAKQKGDSFYIRVHFNYDSEGKGELSFHDGDVFHVVDTLFNGVVGSWFVYRLGRNNQEIQKGSIPNKSRAEELATEQRLENRAKKSNSGLDDLGLTETASSRRSSFFKRRRSARRSKSLCRENWEDVLLGSNDTCSKFQAYERVTLRHPGFVRPVIFFGPLADIAREKLLRDYPDKFESPQAMNGNSNEESTKNSSKANNSGIVRLSVIKEIIDRGKHCLLDITPSAVDRLNYAQFYPIVVFMRVENKSVVKELRNRSSSKNTVHRSSRKLFEQSIKLEKLWHHVFTSSFTLTSGGDLWYKKLIEIIDKQQAQTVWMSEHKPEESISDDFLFPMNSVSRLSYASSPESDLDISLNDTKVDDDDDGDDIKKKEDVSSVSGRLEKASSDPSLAKIDNAAVYSPKPIENVNNNEQQPSPSTDQAQMPLHLLLKKELTKNDSFQKCMEKHQADENISEYPTLKLGETQSLNRNTIESPLPPPPPPPPPLPPCLPPSINSNSAVEIPPPRIDRNSKPSRFRSAHERLFGHSTTSTNNNNSRPTLPNSISASSIPNNSNNLNQTQNDFESSDYINTTVLEYATDNNNNKTLKSEKSLDHLVDDQKSNVLPPRINDPYKFTRSTAQPIQQSQSSSIEHARKLPIPTPVTNGKTPPSPPPKPKLSNNHSTLPYQMNALNINDNRSMIYDQQGYGDYDNMPPLYPLKVPPKRAMEMNNAGPPGYYQSLPQSSYHHGSYPTSSKDHAIQQRYSSHAETISNFINGTTKTPTPYNNNEMNTNFNYKDRASYIDSMQGVKATKVPVHMDYNHPQSNYDNLRYPSTSSSSGLYMNSINYNQTSNLPLPLPQSQQQQANDNTYLNFPFNVHGYDPRHAAMMNNGNGFHNGQPSPLPPPPPLPAYSRSNNPTPNIIQPIPQQARQSGPYLDLSSNRENRGSAFEVYQRKQPMEQSSAHISNTPSSPMYNGLPPPPPLLPVNDFNDANMYTNIDEINNRLSNQSTVIATARGIFGSEGGSLVSAETGVSIIIPPNAIPEGVTQEIYFKVCDDNKLAPPLNRNLGETLLSPTVMCGPHGLRFNIPIELRLPHCAIVNPDSWSFALKSSDINNGEPTCWRNIEGENNFNEQFVSVLVDHF